MKRTVEIVLTIIGMVLFGLPVLVSSILLNTKDNPQVKQELENFMNSPEMQMEGQESMPEISQMIDAMGSFGMFVLIAALIAIGLGILSALFLKGNKKPKAAGIILIVTAIIFTFATVFIGVFGGAVYLIAGIVALVRKPKNPAEEISD
ncbi:DUF4064 domain-containing protein [Halobacillus karajensis]|uniref:ABC-type phosphate transport system, permease component n=1 Tax=Halobacillus karajensis TaxID=195088 RepID=A0A024P986_9BACI|nr:DUF4064 domain-containing protein [Halobacillus karajensis]CDQ21478.1 ABC-type phosphate transport system, permease component [Halobacillus karajensis]CDQ25413.1 ABC-type phosphate transport system, permease component [Halobacillus karajensis]CDQ29737.1 ABC-type phosphate transport system, permease component [Halobacillus karajensis]